MRNCYQFQNQNMFQHGLSVFRHTLQLISGETDNFRIPSWYSKYKTQIISNLHDFKTIKHYNLFHDCGKSLSKIIDDEGKIHYPDHANISAELFKNTIRNDKIIVNLIRYDMIFHTWKYEDIINLHLDSKTLYTLMLTTLAELHSNAEMFGSKESESFIIKFKKLEKLGNKICKLLFEKAYVYVIVRTDLSVAQQAVQAIHVGIEISRKYIKVLDEHPSVILCVVKNENKLVSVMNELKEKGVNIEAFREPDMNNSITAIATEPLCGDLRKLLTRFQLLK